LLQGLLLEPGRIALREIETPEPSGGELLIKVRAALTCGTDLKAFLRGHPLIAMPGPFGHEYSGVVAARGRGVRRFKEGDEVMGVHTAPCLKCGFCRKRLYNLCSEIMGTKAMGAFGEYLLLPGHVVRRNVFKKPPGLSFREAALIEPLSCVVHGIGPLGIKPGDTALVIGAGPIGLLHVVLLRERKAAVAVTDINAVRLKAARDLGAGTFDAGRAPMGFDHVFECTGKPEVWESAVGLLRRGGTLTLFGGCPGGTSVTYDTYRLHYDEITLRGVFHYTPSDVRRAYGLLAGGELKLSGMISGDYRLEELEKAFMELSRGRGIKYAIIP
jgi:L-iditol 2-dehydrogenase